MSLSTQLASTPADRDEAVAAPVWVTRAGWLVLVVSVFGGVFPYFSGAVGLPIDGAPDGAMTLWRTVLHIVPGVAGILAGLGLLDWGRKLGRGQTVANPTVLGRLGMATGGWFAIGPYLWALVEPAHSVGTGGMAGAMHGMTGMSWIGQVIMPMTGGGVEKLTTVNCAITMGLCHWAVGGLVVLASVVALGAGAGTGPLASLGGGRLGATDTGR